MIWPILSCKVGHSVPIGMKLELDLLNHLPDVHTKFQIDISKYVEKNPENLESKTRKNNQTRFETNKQTNRTYVEKYTAAHLCTKFEGFILIYEVMI